MNADEQLINLMRHLDGEAESSPDKDTLSEVNKLKNTVRALEELPLEEPDASTDENIMRFLDDKAQTAANPSKLNQWLPYMLVAASLAMLLYVFLPKKLAQRYDLIETNPDRISFIHELNNQELNSKELLWLVSLLEIEEHPNIRVTLIDLIENQGMDSPVEFAGYLVNERTPAVQMAFLNTLDRQFTPEIRPQLIAFNERADLDPLVRDRIQGILINK